MLLCQDVLHVHANGLITGILSLPAPVYAVSDILRVPADPLYPIEALKDTGINAVGLLTAC